MNKLKETIQTLLAAVGYSFSFCVRNAKRESYWRFALAILNAIVAYLVIWSVGAVVDGIQSIAIERITIETVGNLIDSPVGVPGLTFVASLILGVIINRYAWLHKNRWSHKLRLANQRELNMHRGTLDFARFRSKEFDDLAKRIQELPASWQTRIWFADEMFNLLALIISFATFGSALLFHWKWYALVLVLTSIPMVVGKSKIIGEWWLLFQKLVPHHKERSILERPFHNPVLFAQAIIFNQMPSLRKLIDANADKVVDEYEVIRRKTMRVEMFSNVISVLGLCVVLGHAIWHTTTTAAGIGTLTVLIASARMFQSSLEGIVGLVVDQWNNIKGILLLERDFFGLKPMLETTDPVVPHFKTTPLVRLENVDFTYPTKDGMVLRNVSITIEPGVTCILGPSGSGKTSLAAIIARFYDPSSGNVFIGDLNMRNIKPADLSEHVSVLGQDYSILDRTVAEEIASSRMDCAVDLERVAEAARFSHFEPVVSADPKGYAAQIGTEQGGREFSGGEKQRLALGRVFYRDTKIIILDEPDAKLDAESAQKVIDNIFALKGKSVVLITHQVTRAERADKVIVLEGGQVVESGHPSELLARDGAYARMFRKDLERQGKV